jgi:hypothetical protein
MALVVFPLVMSTEVTPYAAAIKVSNSLQTNLVTLLVPAIHQAAVALRLPRERRSQWDWCTWRQASTFAAILASSHLRSALQAHLFPPAQPCNDGSGSGAVGSNAQRLLATACQLIAHVPMADQAPISLGLMLHKFADLLGEVCSHIRHALQAPMQQQQAGQLPADSHGWQSHGHDRRLAQQLVQVLPQLPFTMQLLVEGGQLQHKMECAESLGIGWCKALDLLQALVSLSPPSLASSSSIVSSWSELSAWCIACAALPRGQALTAVLIGQYESQPAAQRPLSKLEETLRTSRHLAILPAAFAVQQELTGFGAPLPAATVAAAQTALWDLHTALCRSAHQQTAGNVDQIWHGNLDSTNQTLLTAWRLHRCVQRDISQPFGR